MKIASFVFWFLSGLLTIHACVNAWQAPDFLVFVESFTPGFSFACIGVALKELAERNKRPAVQTPTETVPEATAGSSPRLDPQRRDAFGFRAAVGIGFGVGLMLIGGNLGKRSPDWILPGRVLLAMGFVLTIVGCVYLISWYRESTKARTSENAKKTEDNEPRSAT